MKNRKRKRNRGNTRQQEGEGRYERYLNERTEKRINAGGNKTKEIKNRGSCIEGVCVRKLSSEAR